MRAESIRVTGIVQGVGFRPTVWRLARECGVVGHVRNDAEGVLIHAWGSENSIADLADRLRTEQPPLARVDTVVRSPLAIDGTGPEAFIIVASMSGSVDTDVAADAATCDACLAEVDDAGNRRYRYPFTNCTHCGPRLSIIGAIPYDRANTSMAAFNMCHACKQEYDAPADRRFHAQPNACPDCGPTAWLEDNNGARIEPGPGRDAMHEAATLICGGAIVAIKGIGGFHLACDATNEDTVKQLRQRKRRFRKAFAMMARDVDMIARYAKLDSTENALLQDTASPITVLETGNRSLPGDIAPGQSTLGFMLPYTPLHHLLMQSIDEPIVLTSGNTSDEPQVIDNATAREKLGGIADYFLMHDRDILNRLDDSVVRVISDDTRFIRRARGYAPEPMRLHESFAGGPTLTAMGGELKNTFCLLSGDKAIVSQHIGDMEDMASVEDQAHNLGLYEQLYEHRPDSIVVDTHPDYLPTKIGHQLANERGIPIIEVQHHHAHIASCLAEHGHPIDGGRVLGIALDGIGYGDDGTFWGGEFLAADFRSYERICRFAPMPLPGGVRAMQEPWRNTWAQLRLDWDRVRRKHGQLDIVRFLENKPLETLERMVQRGLNSPQASSCGRLFDAVAAAVGVSVERVCHEGQAAIELGGNCVSLLRARVRQRVSCRHSRGRYARTAFLVDLARAARRPVAGRTGGSRRGAFSPCTDTGRRDRGHAACRKP